jgi:DNA-binding response OmpR family regulator
MKILLIDSDRDVVAAIDRALRREGYRVVVASAIEEARVQLDVDAPDLIILGANAAIAQVCSFISEFRHISTTPIVVIGVDPDECAIVRSLDSGADSYLPWPFAMRELMLRVRKLLCDRLRTHLPREQVQQLAVGDLLIDLAAYRVLKNGIALRLTRLEIEMLHRLVQSTGTWVELRSLAECIGRNRSVGHTAHVKTHVSHIRRKLNDAGGHAISIRAVPRGGYVLSV